ncbi:MAG: hypothetical protein RLZZ488_527 [Pseudomonadota bacterium]
MLGRSLPLRIALLSSFIGGGCVLFSAAFFGAYQQNQLEKQLINEARQYAERFTTWTLGYFYQQDNLLHLETQQRFLAESPNIVYSYIVKDNGNIDVGIAGVNSPDVGQRKQGWEPDIQLDVANQTSVSFTANPEVVSRFSDKVAQGDDIMLVGFPISCPERATPCAQLRVALVAQTARETAGRLTLSFIIFGILAATGTGLAVFYAARKQVFPLIRLTRLMEQAQESGEQSVQSVRRALGVTDTEETRELTSLRRSLLSYLDVLELSTAQGAIARSTQAFAHDVRKPFSMFRAIIDSVRSTSDLAQVREILVRAIPEVSRAMLKVDVMIQDVMRIGTGTESRLNVQSVEPQELIGNTLEEIFRVYPDADVQLEYEFLHSAPVQADVVQTGRVLLNIIENAIHAMGGKGHLWFKSKDDGRMVEICVGNAGSLIAPEAISKLFDLFYTSGKEGGTGLGLAIAKKIVELHGGKIRCESTSNAQFPQGKVEFFFTLPAASQKSATVNRPLASHARDFAHLHSNGSGAAGSSAAPASRETDGSEPIIRAISEVIAKNTATHTILVVDDETVYSESLRGLLQSVAQLKNSFEFTWLQKAPQPEQIKFIKNLLLIVQDIDLGVGQTDGLASIRIAREAGFKGHICVHSNRLLAGDNKAALEAGADTIIPKPMTRTHFLKIILDALSRTKKTARIAYLDDSDFMLHVMKTRVGQKCELLTFNSPHAFFAAVQADGQLLSSLDAIITDYFFSSSDGQTGFDVARQLRSLGYQKSILLLTDAELQDSVCKENGVTAKISKSAGWNDIASRLP